MSTNGTNLGSLLAYANMSTNSPQVVADVIDILKEKMTTLEEAMLSSMSLRFAQSAVSGGQSFQASEASRLVNDLFACSDSEITPQGKKIYVCLTTADLDKRF